MTFEGLWSYFGSGHFIENAKRRLSAAKRSERKKQNTFIKNNTWIWRWFVPQNPFFASSPASTMNFWFERPNWSGRPSVNLDGPPFRCQQTRRHSFSYLFYFFLFFFLVIIGFTGTPRASPEMGRPVAARLVWEQQHQQQQQQQQRQCRLVSVQSAGPTASINSFMVLKFVCRSMDLEPAVEGWISRICKQWAIIRTRFGFDFFWHLRPNSSFSVFFFVSKPRPSGSTLGRRRDFCRTSGCRFFFFVCTSESLVVVQKRRAPQLRAEELASFFFVVLFWIFFFWLLLWLLLLLLLFCSGWWVVCGFYEGLIPSKTTGSIKDESSLPNSVFDYDAYDAKVFAMPTSRTSKASDRRPSLSLSLSLSNINQSSIRNFFSVSFGEFNSLIALSQAWGLLQLVLLRLKKKRRNHSTTQANYQPSTHYQLLKTRLNRNSSNSPSQ